jgi:hypothetical protein
MTDHPHERESRKLAIMASELAKVVPHLPSATLVIVGALLALYGLFDLADHYQAQGASHAQTILGHRLPSPGSARPLSLRASRSSRLA